MSTEPDVLVIGASGLVGTALMRRLGARACGTYRQNGAPGLVPLDVCDAPAVRDLVAQTRPRAVVHCAAWTHVDGCEEDPERSHAINVDGVGNVARAAAAIDARMIFISSDYVFGDGGPHAISEQPAPLNVYGRHKLEAERVVATTVRDRVVVRSCNVYGYQPGGKNFVMAVLEYARASRKLRAPSDQWGNPTLADDLAAAIGALTQSELRGVLHLAGPDYVDRPAWARRAAEAFGFVNVEIDLVSTAELGQPARRPLRAGLESREFYARVGVEFRGLTEGLAAVAALAKSMK